MKQNYDNEFTLEVWGDFACFTRPEFKVERVSYEVITPSAARAIFDAIFWKPAIRWQINSIEVLRPIRWTTIRRNEVGAVASVNKDCIYIEDARQQRAALILRDVKYRIHATMVYIPVGERKGEKAHTSGDDECPVKYHEMFLRRASKGQCFTQPYLGTREFSAYFRLVANEKKGLEPAIDENRDLGIMHYDMDFNGSKSLKPLYFKAQMCKGVISVPELNSKEVLR